MFFSLSRNIVPPVDSFVKVKHQVMDSAEDTLVDDVTLSKEEQDEKDNIVKLSGFSFSKSPNEGKKSVPRGMSFQPSLMDDDIEDFVINDDEEYEDEETESEDDLKEDHEPTKRASRSQMYEGSQFLSDYEDEEREDDYDEESPTVEGAYDPREFEHLNVDPEVANMFSYINKFRPQSIILDYKMKPFIPDYIPAVGDIDAFIKVLPPVINAQDKLGLTVLDEPEAVQSDPNVLDLQLRAVSKTSSAKAARSKKVCGGGDAGSVKEISQWIRDISDLHRSKPPPSVNYRHPMPDTDTLMQEWPPEFDQTLSNTSLPDLETLELETSVDLICSLLDIPVYKSRLESLHVLFSLYGQCKNQCSQQI